MKLFDIDTPLQASLDGNIGLIKKTCCHHKLLDPGNLDNASMWMRSRRHRIGQVNDYIGMVYDLSRKYGMYSTSNRCICIAYFYPGFEI